MSAIWIKPRTLILYATLYTTRVAQEFTLLVCSHICCTPASYLRSPWLKSLLRNYLDCGLHGVLFLQDSTTNWAMSTFKPFLIHYSLINISFIARE